MMRRLDMVQWGADRLRIGAWRGDDRVAMLTPLPGHPAGSMAILRAVHRLRDQGLDRAITAALPAAEAAPFLDAGFVVRERLELLRHDLTDLPPMPAVSLRRGWRRDQDAVLALDARSFSPFWRFDRLALLDARAATPASQFRIAGRGRPQGYAVTGRSGAVGYLQRLAVDPDHQGHGIGTALIVDALGWARQHRADHVLVNTQEANTGAVRLYERLGFTHEPSGLSVLDIDLVAADRLDDARPRSTTLDSTGAAASDVEPESTTP